MIWWILGGILLLVALLLISNLGADIIYKDTKGDLRVTLNGITVYKMPLERAEEEMPALKESPKAKSEAREKAAVKTFLKFSEIISFAKRTGGIFYAKMVKKIHVRTLKVHLFLYGEDAVSTVMTCGALSGVAHTAFSALSHMLTLHMCDVDISPNYSENAFKADIRVKFDLRIIHAPLVAIALYPIYKEIMEIKERESKNERTSNQRSNLEHHAKISRDDRC